MCYLPHEGVVLAEHGVFCGPLRVELLFQLLTVDFGLAPLVDTAGVPCANRSRLLQRMRFDNFSHRVCGMIQMDTKRVIMESN